MRLVVCVMLALPLLVGRAGAAEDSQATDLARGHYQLGEVLYKQGRYAEAMHEFVVARDLLKRPQFDYNIAACLEKLGQPKEAAAALERYLQARPNDPDAELIRQRIAGLRSRGADTHAGAATASTATAPTAPAPEAAVTVSAPPPPRRRLKPWVIGVISGVGAAVAIGAGIALGVTLGSREVGPTYSLGRVPGSP